MSHSSVIKFGREVLRPEDVRGRSVIEVGSLDVNGSLRRYIEADQPGSYLGVDIISGPGVDEVCDAGDLVARFGSERFEVVVTTEMMEHVRDWRRVVSNLKQVLRPGGLLVLTTRSLGFPYHGFPHDFWRYEVADMRAIFADFTIDDLRPDPDQAGVFLRARKPMNFREADLSQLALHSMVKGRRLLGTDEASVGRPWWSGPVHLLRRSGVFGMIPGSFKIRVQKYLGIR